MQDHSFIIQIAITFIERLGYAGLTLGLILNSMGVLLPSEILIPLAGVVAKQGGLSVVWVITLAVLGQLVGAVLSHWIGLRGGAPLVHKYGKYLLLSHRDLTMAHRWFERYGEGVVILAYCLPVVRGYIGYAAGIAEMSRGKFIIGAGVGALIWTCLLIGLGYGVADNLDAIERIIRPFSIVIVILLGAVVGYFIWHRLRERIK